LRASSDVREMTVEGAVSEAIQMVSEAL